MGKANEGIGGRVAGLGLVKVKGGFKETGKGKDILSYTFFN